MKTLGIIGIGNMGEALVRALASSKNIKTNDIFIYDVDRSKVSDLAQSTGVNQTSSVNELCQKSSNIILAVKPYQINSLAKEISNFAKSGLTVISIAAGVSLKTLNDLLDRKETKCVRVMPNTPMLVSQGAGAIAFSDEISSEKRSWILDLFNDTGLFFEVPENQMNAITGLSGSGPAYVFLIIEALAAAGIKEGLSHDMARKLAAQTLKGAAELLLSGDLHPAVLKDMVTSPGGTTAAGLATLEEYGLRSALIKGVAAATNRAKELD